MTPLDILMAQQFSDKNVKVFVFDKGQSSGLLHLKAELLEKRIRRMQRYGSHICKVAAKRAKRLPFDDALVAVGYPR